VALLSIITIHLQDFEGLENTYASIRAVIRRQEVEWVVIDGGSQPDAGNGCNIISDVASAADIFLSEPDEGIFDAMNKGVKNASGKYFMFINAGDRLVSDLPIDEVLRICRKQSPDMIWGYTIKEFPDGKSACIKNRRPGLAWIGMPVCHQSVIFSRDLFAKKKYDTGLPLTADYEFLLWSLHNGATIHYLEQPISHYQAGGQSQVLETQTREERDRIRQRYYGIPTLINRCLSWMEWLVSTLNSISPGFYRSWRKRF
jgi:glycosyltransferase involved in cell wall biosynthesis